MALFENYERRIDKINGVLKQYGIESVEACREMCQAKGFDPYGIANTPMYDTSLLDVQFLGHVVEVDGQNTAHALFLHRCV